MGAEGDTALILNDCGMALAPGERFTSKGLNVHAAMPMVSESRA
jgi:hypothetical protein